MVSHYFVCFPLHLAMMKIMAYKYYFGVCFKLVTKNRITLNWNEVWDGTKYHFAENLNVLLQALKTSGELENSKLRTKSMGKRKALTNNCANGGGAHSEGPATCRVCV